MPSRKAAKAADPVGDVVVVPFAYATAKDGEVVQLVRGSEVSAERYTAESIEHLRSIGFVGPQN